MLANIFTKALPCETFITFHELLNIYLGTSSSESVKEVLKINIKMPFQVLMSSGS